MQYFIVETHATRKSAFLFNLLFACRLLSRPAARYELITVNEGLSQGMVFDVLESREGFIWIATKDGLNRYDGYRFEIYSPNPFDPFSIGSSKIRRLHGDKRGWLWCSSEGRMDVFMPETGQFFHLPLLPGFDGYVRSFVEMPDETMWVVCNFLLWKIEADVSVLQKAATANQPFPEIRYSKMEWPVHGAATPIAGFNSTIFTKEQTLLAGTGNGLYKVDPVTGQLHPQPEILPGNLVSIIGEDTSGWLWLRTKDAV